MRALAALLMLATPTAAQDWPLPWDGYWRVAAQGCAQAARCAGADRFHETVCHGIGARALDTPAAWEVVMRCDDGGRVWEAVRIVILGTDRKRVWFGPDGSAPIEFLRCETGGEY